MGTNQESNGVVVFMVVITSVSLYMGIMLAAFMLPEYIPHIELGSAIVGTLVLILCSLNRNDYYTRIKRQMEAKRIELNLPTPT
jgi:hypothetical protein